MFNNIPVQKLSINLSNEYSQLISHHLSNSKDHGKKGNNNFHSHPA